MAEVTVPTDLESEAEDYVIVAPFSEADQQKLHALQDQMAARLNPSSLWLPRGDQLHITFGHIIGPSPDQAVNRELYERLGPGVLRTLADLVPNPLRIEVACDEVEASPHAIIVKGRDDGTYESLRRAFAREVQVPASAKPTPAIIHTTIARFVEEADFAEVQAGVQGLEASFGLTSEVFQLVHETKIYRQEYEVLAEFPAVPGVAAGLAAGIDAI